MKHGYVAVCTGAAHSKRGFRKIESSHLDVAGHTRLCGSEDIAHFVGLSDSHEYAIHDTHPIVDMVMLTKRYRSYTDADDIQTC
jgi:hypothetical protein